MGQAVLTEISVTLDVLSAFQAFINPTIKQLNNSAIKVKFDNQLENKKNTLGCRAFRESLFKRAG